MSSDNALKQSKLNQSIEVAKLKYFSSPSNNPNRGPLINRKSYIPGVSTYTVLGHGCDSTLTYTIPENCALITYSECGLPTYHTDRTKELFTQLFDAGGELITNPISHIQELRSQFNEDFHFHYKDAPDDFLKTYTNLSYQPISFFDDSSVYPSGLRMAGTNSIQMQLNTNAYDYKVIEDTDTIDTIKDNSRFKKIVLKLAKQFNGSLYPTVNMIVKHMMYFKPNIIQYTEDYLKELSIELEKYIQYEQSLAQLDDEILQLENKYDMLSEDEINIDLISKIMELYTTRQDLYKQRPKPFYNIESPITLLRKAFYKALVATLGRWYSIDLKTLFEFFPGTYYHLVCRSDCFESKDNTNTRKAVILRRQQSMNAASRNTKVQSPIQSVAPSSWWSRLTGRTRKPRRNRRNSRTRRNRF